MNNNVLTNILVFAAGAAIGSVVTWKLVKTKYEQIAQEEIDSVKEVFARRASTEKPSLDEYISKLNDQGYNTTDGATTAPDEYEEEEETESMVDDMAYVIAPDEFGEFDDYETISLTYYADEVLADDMDDPIDDTVEIVGPDALMRFGEYEEDAVYVRNDKLKTDYEILLDTRKYSEVTRH